MSTIKSGSALALVLLLSAVAFGGCLTAARKTISLKVETNGSGTGKIVFYDIKSMQEDNTDRSLEDYSRLVDTWLHGTQFEAANPALLDVKKRLVADGNQLNGEISFRFLNYNDIGLYRHNDAGPWMYYAYLNTSEIEQFDSSNGDFAGETMPIIFWPPLTKEFEIMNVFESGDRPEVSLFPLYERIGDSPKH